MSDARGTAIYCFTGITHISEKDFQMLLACIASNNVHEVKYSNNKIISKIQNADN